MAIDPICGMHVDEKKAIFKKDVDGKTIYFCSETCIKTYEAPEVEFKKLRLYVILSGLIAIPVVILSFFYQLPYKSGGRIGCRNDNVLLEIYYSSKSIG